MLEIGVRSRKSNFCAGWFASGVGCSGSHLHSHGIGDYGFGCSGTDTVEGQSLVEAVSNS